MRYFIGGFGAACLVVGIIFIVSSFPNLVPKLFGGVLLVGLAYGLSYAGAKR